MKQIEFERWEPDAENPCKLKYAGQRTAEDVFHELEARLDSVGYWLFGHYHDNRIIDEKYVMLYEQMVRIL